LQFNNRNCTSSGKTAPKHITTSLRAWAATRFAGSFAKASQTGGVIKPLLLLLVPDDILLYSLLLLRCTAACGDASENAVVLHDDEDDDGKAAAPPPGKPAECVESLKVPPP